MVDYQTHAERRDTETRSGGSMTLEQRVQQQLGTLVFQLLVAQQAYADLRADAGLPPPTARPTEPMP